MNCIRILIVAALFLFGVNSLSAAQAMRVLEKSIDHFEPKVRTSKYLPQPIWINDRQLVASVFKAGEKLELYDENDPVDTVLIDFSRKFVKVISEGVFAWSFNPETRVLVVGRMRSEFPSDEQRYDRFKELLLDENGNVEILKSYAPGSFPVIGGKRFPRDVQVRSSGLQDIGYFIKASSNAQDSGQSEGQNMGHDDATLWIRPGREPLSLKIRFKDFSSSMQAVLFAGGYLLDIEDTYGKPFRLLRGDGGVELIPYPEALYSIRYPADKYGRRADFVYVHLTKLGFLVRQIMPTGENRLYLLGDDSAFRLVGSGAMLGMVGKIWR